VTHSLVVRGLGVETAGHRRLDGVDLTLRPTSFVAVLGTSGAGKSTLLKAITGTDPATEGSVVFDGLDVYTSFDTVRRQIGYVPQDDILHPQLTVFETLEFASRLRFPPDMADRDRLDRIHAVIAELGLTARADARVDQLSGGQRKRVNVSLELLTEPALLILDEPTSGLDPGNERLLMELLRQLADRGRMIIVVTHSIESLHLCDEVLFLARGGIPIYNGPPAALPVRFAATGFAEVFARIESMDDPSSLRLPRTTAAQTPVVLEPRPKQSLVDRARSTDPAVVGRHFRILTERYLRVLASDRRNLLILALQAPVMAVLMLAVFPAGKLQIPDVPFLDPKPEAGNVLMALVLAAVWLGASNAVREVVKERSILRREQNFGLSVSAYLGSKLVPLGVITVAQSVLLVVVGTIRQKGPTNAVSALPAVTELLILVSVCGLSALCLGLLLSAVVNSTDKAMTLLPVLLFAQFLLAGLIFPVSGIGIQQLSWFATARWGFAGAASTVDYWTLRGCDNAALKSSDNCSVLWHHTGAAWSTSYTMLCVLGAVALFLAWRSIVRADPAESLGRPAKSRSASRAAALKPAG